MIAGSLTNNDSVTYVPNCSLCKQKVTIPVQVDCHHIFDLHCIGDLHKACQCCPIDKTKVTEFVSRSELIEKVGATFHFQFSPGSGIRVEPLMISLSASTLLLKIIAAHASVTGESNSFKAVYKGWKGDIYQVAKQWECMLKTEKNENSGVQLCGKLSENGLEAGKTYTVVMKWTLAKAKNN